MFFFFVSCIFWVDFSVVFSFSFSSNLSLTFSSLSTSGLVTQTAIEYQESILPTEPDNELRQIRMTLGFFLHSIAIYNLVYFCANFFHHFLNTKKKKILGMPVSKRCRTENVTQGTSSINFRPILNTPNKFKKAQGPLLSVHIREAVRRMRPLFHSQVGFNSARGCWR